MISFANFVSNLTEGKDVGTYAAFVVSDSSKKDLIEFSKKLGLTPVDDHHVTTMYSDKVIPNYKPYDGGEIEVTPVGYDVFGHREDKKYLVLKVESPVVRKQWKKGRDLGATWDYPDFKPHISLAIGPPEAFEKFDVKKLPLPKFPIKLSHEYTEELKPD